MYPSSKVGILGLVASSLLMAANLTSTVQAASTSVLSAQTSALSCDRNPNIDPSLRICVNKYEGVAYYRMDTIDGTHADVVVSSKGVSIRQAGPDAVHLSLTAGPAAVDHLAQGVTKRVYQDEVLTIDVQQDHQGLPTFWIRLLSLQTVPFQRMCTGADCSNGAQHP